MASSIELVDFVTEQINREGNARYKKMFGDYMVYYKNKPIFLLCDDVVYVKINAVTKSLLGDAAETASPYDGAKPHYIVGASDDRDFMMRLAEEFEKITPLPKVRQKKSPKTV